MTKEEAIDRLKELQQQSKSELTHIYADDVLCELLFSLGYKDVVNEWCKVKK